jgi:aconitate hydratase
LQPQSVPLAPLPPNAFSAANCVDLGALLAGRKTALPKSMMVLLENLARQTLKGADVGELMAAIIDWRSDAPELVLPVDVTRVIMPDSSGLPALMDLAAARDAIAASGGEPRSIEPKVPVTLVIDHSLIVDYAGRRDAPELNVAREFSRNAERYAFFKWAEQAFDGLRIVPPGTGIIHQVHLEKLAHVVAEETLPDGRRLAFPEFVLGCDSHTTMINGIGLLGWGVGGIDGEMAALGHPYSVRIPKVIGVRLTGRLPLGAMPTDLVLTITSRLRQHGVVGAFVEFFGDGLDTLPVADRATIANMAPEYGATVGYFPIDAQTLDYLRQSGREPDHVALVEAHAKTSGLFRHTGDPEPEFSEVIEIDLGAVSISVAGPKRPQDLIALKDVGVQFKQSLAQPTDAGGFGLAAPQADASIPVDIDGEPIELRHGSILVAAITSCTNTSNPTVMIGAGLLARNARARGLSVPVWVKTSLAPGSRLVRDYLTDTGLLDPLEQLGFHIVGYGCTTCSGKSGPVRPELETAVSQNDLVTAAVLSGNRNFEGRIHKTCRANFLASPPLVVAYALAGRVDIDLDSEPLGVDSEGRDVFLSDIWPDPAEIASLVQSSQKPGRFHKSYATLFDGPELWEKLESPKGPQFKWDANSSYIKRPPFFDLPGNALPDEIAPAQALVKCGDSLTTDHITPSGEILPESLAGRYLISEGVEPENFNAVTQRRGNHEFMARITFANQRFKNLLAGGIEGGVTRLAPDADLVPIFDAAAAIRADGRSPIILAGKDYGMGSSRDWAAKGPKLLGVAAVLARSYERIHRANLIGVGIVPLEFENGQSAQSLGLAGFEEFAFAGIHAALDKGAPVRATANRGDGSVIRFTAGIAIAGDHEKQLLRQGGIFKMLLAGAAPQ